MQRTVSDTYHSRGVRSWREGSKESVGSMLEFTKLGTTFCSAKDEGLIGAGPKDVLAR